MPATQRIVDNQRSMTKYMLILPYHKCFSPFHVGLDAGQVKDCGEKKNVFSSKPVARFEFKVACLLFVDSTNWTGVFFVLLACCTVNIFHSVYAQTE